MPTSTCIKKQNANREKLSLSQKARIKQIKEFLWKKKIYCKPKTTQKRKRTIYIRTLKASKPPDGQ